jgi:threonine dehydrogenase-like Zn-dependent dehydrogenase
MIVKDIPLPVLEKDEILVKVTAASLCGSDLVSYRGYLGPKTEGMVGGHEAVGIVVKCKIASY